MYIFGGFYTGQWAIGDGCALKKTIKKLWNQFFIDKLLKHIFMHTSTQEIILDLNNKMDVNNWKKKYFIFGFH